MYCVSSSKVILQGFRWTSHRHSVKYEQSWYGHLKENVKSYKNRYSHVWLPPPSKSVSPEGYLPLDLYDLNSEYGTKYELIELLDELSEYDIVSICDIVINHRCAKYQNNGVWNQFGDTMCWDESMITSNNLRWEGTGNMGTGEEYIPAPNIDHTNKRVQEDIKEWMLYLKNLGFKGWRYDFVKGYSGEFVKMYNECTDPEISIGEYWDTCEYDLSGQLEFNQDSHRQRIINWIDSTDGTSSAFDITTRAILLESLKNQEYWRLAKFEINTGVMGYWSPKAVTFVENHDTSHQWTFDEHLLELAYVYILTHPGIPCVYWEHRNYHIVDKLIEIRNEYDIQEDSKLTIVSATYKLYHAVIDDSLHVKIGNDIHCDGDVLLQGNRYIIFYES